MTFLRAVLKEMHIHQWTKNLLVYAAALFSGGLLAADELVLSTMMFLAFSLVSSSVYFFNDIFDYEKDRQNPKKRHRPIAAGLIGRGTGLCLSLALAAGGLVLASFVRWSCFGWLLSYALLNLAYTVQLKHVVIIDVMIIAYGFVARAVVGAEAIRSSMTAWFLLCVTFLSLFLALGKRRHELLAVEEKAIEGRKVLEYYSLGLIDQLMTVVTSALLLCYALFTMDPSTRDGAAIGITTIPLVIYGMFYYLYIVRVRQRGGAPDEALYKEKPIPVVAVLYIVAILVIRNL